ncbi:LysR family transcriptional regulator [Pseudonocardia spinosispora]|uniref:LysR family transcriptional regulator n=1 Tax=Pseudonocardia spinosispora TaxID=103441 RepID=UPI000402D517|nr:LysR family transcriptional regulator [Pseudonocardia spinosispora]
MTRPELALHQLHAFVVLAEELHFGRAAQRLGIAQPPLSQQIQRLETKVGHALFDRGPGRVVLTATGRELLPAARRALQELDRGLDAARRIGTGASGRLRVGFAASLALTVLPGLLRAYRADNPDVVLEIEEMTTAPQLAALRDRRIDIGLLREPPAEPGLCTEPLLTEKFVAVLPVAHRLASLRRVPVTALADEPFVLLPRHVGPTVHDRIVTVCRDAGFEPRVAQHAVEWQTVCALVEAGFGVSLAPASIRRIRLRGVVCRGVEPESARTTVSVCWRDADPDPLVDRFLARARSTITTGPR